MTIEKLDKRIEELKVENAADRERLVNLEKEYESAVNNFESTKIDKLHAEITGIKSTVENRVKQIAILVNPDNPLRIKAQADRFKAVEGERDAVKAKADALHNKLAKAQAEYINLANEVFAINKEHNDASRSYHHASGNRGQFHAVPYLVPAKYEVYTGPVQNTRNDYEFKGGK